MREVEFKAKRKDNGEWVYGSLEHITETCKGEEDVQKCDIYQIITYDGIGFDIIPETIGQYTGLKDKNGKKIFEGDIVKDQYCIYEVVYDGNGYYVEVNRLLKECGTEEGILYDLSDYKDLEVIGNIYDNPELYEVEL